MSVHQKSFKTFSNQMKYLQFSIILRIKSEQEVAELAGQNVADFDFGYSCPNASRCWDASASITLDWKAIAHFGASDPGGSVAIADKGQLGEIRIHDTLVLFFN